MKTLQQLAQSHPNWSLDEFVQTTNDLLPQFLPETQVNTRVREEITPRLIRHYGSLNMLDEPLKQGREARYNYRHLLQILLVRRLLAEGYGASAIDRLATIKSDLELEALLQGGVQLTVAPANPALAYLQQIQQRQSVPTPTPISNQAKSAPSQSPTSEWTRVEILPGLEIHIKDDFTYPNSPQEQQNLWQYIKQTLQAAITRRRTSK